MAGRASSPSRTDRRRLASPQATNGDPVKHLGIADDREILDLCLGNEHTVKRSNVNLTFESPRDTILAAAI